MCSNLEALNAMGGGGGLSMRIFGTLGGAEHAQTFNFGTAKDSDNGFELPFLPRE